MTKHTPLVAAVLTVLALAGCGEAGNAAARDDRVLVAYERTGGFVGVDESLKVTREGRVTVAAGRHRQLIRFRLTSDEQRALRAELRRADIPTLRGPRGPMAGADFYEYAITSGGRTVRFWTTRIPSRASRLVRMLDGIVATGVRRAPRHVDRP